MIAILRNALAVAVAFALASCARVPREAGFGDVKTLAEARAGAEVIWDRGGPEGERLRETVRAKLAEELTPESAAQIALLNNRRLQSVYQQLGLSQAEVVEAGLLPNPVLDASVKQSINGGEGPELELTLVQEFVKALTLPLRRKIAQAEFEETKLAVAQEILALAVETRAQFYIVQADGQMLEMMRHACAATSASAETARALHEAGNIRDLDYDREAAMHSEARLALAEAEIAGRKNRERLNILMGLWGADAAVKVPFRLADTPETEIDGADIERRVVEKNLDLAMLRQHILALERRLGLARGTALFPEFGIGGGFKLEPDGNEMLGPALSIPIPLWDQGQPHVAKARAELARLQEELWHKAVETRAAARAGWDHLQLARARALHARDVALPLRHRILEETQLEYNAMQTGVFQLLEAKREEIEAGRRRIETLRDYWLARAEVDSLLAGHVTSVGFETTALDATMGSALH